MKFCVVEVQKLNDHICGWICKSITGDGTHSCYRVYAASSHWHVPLTVKWF